MRDLILHIDGDGFFAYCEIARFPHLRGKPVVVGEERGIVCASTYEAKRLGITRAMPLFEVRQRFPEVTILPCHFELYEHYAAKLAAIVEPEVDVLERYSIDECFARVSFPDNADIAAWLATLKKRVQTATGLTYSFGLAETKVLAKVASKRQKPDGCTVLLDTDVPAALAETPIESIWGIGWKTSRRLLNMKVRTAADFIRWSEGRVAAFFSLPIQELWHELQGRRMFAVSDIRDAPKSLQSTRSFKTTTEWRFVLAELLYNADVAFSRLRGYGLATNAISLFLKTKDRQYQSASIPLPRYTSNVLDVSAQIEAEASRLFQRGTVYRSTGISLYNLREKESVPQDLFGIQQSVEERDSVMYAIDAIRGKYGTGSIGILASIPSTACRKRQGRGTYEFGLPLPYLGEVS